MCRDESGVVAEDAWRQCFSVAVHHSRQLMLFFDGFTVMSVEPLASAGISSCLSLIQRLTIASDQALSRMLTHLPSLKLSCFNTFTDCSVIKQRVRDTTAGIDSEITSRYHFEAPAADPTLCDPDEEITVGSYIDHIDRGRILFGHAENLTSEEHGVNADVEPDGVLSSVSKALMLSWSLAATHSGTWSVDHESIADVVACNFIKLFAVILGDGENGAEDGARLQRVLEFYRRIVRVSAMDHIERHLPLVLVTFVCRSTELFLKMRLTGAKGLHTLHAVALAIRFAEQQYAKTYSLATTVNSPRLSSECYLDHINVASDMFNMPSVFGADRLDWVGLKKNQPGSATLHNRSANLFLSFTTLLFDRFLIMYYLCVFTCIILIFVFHCTHVRMSYVLNSYLLTYLLTLMIAVAVILINRIK